MKIIAAIWCITGLCVVAGAQTPPGAMGGNLFEPKGPPPKTRLSEAVNMSARQGFKEGGAWAVSWEGTRILGQTEDGVFRVFDTCTGKQLAHLELHKGDQQAWAKKGGLGALSAQGRTVAVANGSSTVLLWDAPTGKQIQELKADGGAQLCCVCFSADGGTLYAGNAAAGGVCVFDAQSGALVAHLVEGGHISSRMSIAHDGGLLATGPAPGSSNNNNNKDLSIWNLKNRQLWALWGMPPSGAGDFEITPESELMIVLGGMPRFFDPRAGTEHQRPGSNLERVWTEAFSSDGKLTCVAGDIQGTAYAVVQESQSGRILQRLNIGKMANGESALQPFFMPSGQAVILYHAPEMMRVVPLTE